MGFALASRSFELLPAQSGWIVDAPSTQPSRFAIPLGRGAYWDEKSRDFVRERLLRVRLSASASGCILIARALGHLEAAKRSRQLRLACLVPEFRD